LQGRDCRIALGKEQPWKNQHRGGGIDVEIIELDGGSDHAGQKDAARGPRIGHKVRLEQWVVPRQRLGVADTTPALKPKITGLSRRSAAYAEDQRDLERLGMDGADRPAGAGR